MGDLTVWEEGCRRSVKASQSFGAAVTKTPWTEVFIHRKLFLTILRVDSLRTEC